MASEDPLEEMIQFLAQDARDDVKLFSLQNILGMTGDTDGILTVSQNMKLLTAVIAVTCHEKLTFQKLAFEILVNVMANEDTSWLLLLNSDNQLNSRLTTWMLKCLDPSCVIADVTCKVLSNVTRAKKCAEKCATTLVKQNSDILQNIITALSTVNYNPKVSLDRLALVLSNLTQSAEVRGVLLNKETGLFLKLLPFIEHKVRNVRLGVVGAIRNCCFDTGHHDWLLSDDVDLLPRLLLPLAGPEEFDDEDNEGLPLELQYLEPEKQREVDAKVRHMLVETVYQFCATKPGREYLKKKNTYLIMRELHKWETDKKNDLAIYNLIDILIGDEPAADMANLKDIEVPENIQEKFEKEDAEFFKD